MNSGLSIAEQQAVITSPDSLHYLQQHELPENLNAVLLGILTRMPRDPIVVMEKELRALSRKRANTGGEDDRVESSRGPV